MKRVQCACFATKNVRKIFNFLRRLALRMLQLNSFDSKRWATSAKLEVSVVCGFRVEFTFVEAFEEKKKTSQLSFQLVSKHKHTVKDRAFLCLKCQREITFLKLISFDRWDGVTSCSWKISFNSIWSSEICLEMNKAEISFEGKCNMFKDEKQAEKFFAKPNIDYEKGIH